MEKNDRIRLYDAAIKKWGIEPQKTMLYEELGELITALSQYTRGRATKEDVLTELADATIMIEQIALLLGFDDYEDELEKKLVRLRDKKLKLNNDSK